MDGAKRSHLNHQQLMNKVLEFKKANMNDMKDVLYSAEPQTQESKKLRLNITGNESGITTISATILETCIKSHCYPWKCDSKTRCGRRIVYYRWNMQQSTQRYAGKGGCLSYDRLCVNFSTKICEHVLAVAQKKHMLDEFLTWFKRKHPSNIDMVEQGGPKTAGRKPSGRK